MIDIKQLAAFMSQASVFDFVNAAKDDAEKRSRIEQMKQKFLAQSNFSSVNFSAEIADFGSPEGIYECDFATFNNLAKEKAAFDNIRRLTVVHSVKDSIKKFLLQRNSVVAANRAKAKEKEIQKKDKFVSQSSIVVLNRV